MQGTGCWCPSVDLLIRAPQSGALHHHKPGTEAGHHRVAEQRSACLSLPTTDASFAGEVQWKCLCFCRGGLCVSGFESLVVEPTNYRDEGDALCVPKRSRRMAAAAPSPPRFRPRGDYE